MDVHIDLSQVSLQTERLLLRPWRDSDLRDFYAYASVPGVGEMAGWKHHESLEESQKILAMFMEEKNTLAVCHQIEQNVIGSIGLHASPANELSEYAPLRLKEIGYVLSNAYWGQGLMPEAVDAVLSFCFDKCGLDAVTVGHFAENHQSKRVIEKCGFTLYGKGVFQSKTLQTDFPDLRYIRFSDLRA